MRTTLYIILSLILLTSACDDQDQSTSCQVNSIEDLDWLQEEIENQQYSKPSTYMDVLIYQTTYQGKTVIVTTICCPLCDTMPPKVKNCSGHTIGRLGVEIDYSILDTGTVIWRTHNGICP